MFADAKALAVDATEVETRRLVSEAYATAPGGDSERENPRPRVGVGAAPESEVKAMAEGLVESVDADQLTA